MLLMMPMCTGGKEAACGLRRVGLGRRGRVRSRACRLGQVCLVLAWGRPAGWVRGEAGPRDGAGGAGCDGGNGEEMRLGRSFIHEPFHFPLGLGEQHPGSVWRR